MAQIFDTLVTNGTTTTNPAPSSLSPKNPTWTGYAGGNMGGAVSAAWTTQAKKGIFPMHVKDGRGELPIPIYVALGAGVTSVVLNVWYYNPDQDVWFQFPSNTPSVTITANGAYFIENGLALPMFLQLSTFVGGTQASIYVDQRVAKVL
jgi:hypothetical protein